MTTMVNNAVSIILPTIVKVLSAGYDIWIGKGSMFEFNLAEIQKQCKPGEPPMMRFRKIVWSKFRNDKFFRRSVLNLQGKRLGCDCKDKKRCHGNVLIRLMEYMQPRVKEENPALLAWREKASRFTQETDAVQARVNYEGDRVPFTNLEGTKEFVPEIFTCTDCSTNWRPLDLIAYGDAKVGAHETVNLRLTQAGAGLKALKKVIASGDRDMAFIITQAILRLNEKAFKAMEQEQCSFCDIGFGNHFCPGCGLHYDLSPKADRWEGEDQIIVDQKYFMGAYEAKAMPKKYEDPKPRKGFHAAGRFEKELPPAFLAPERFDTGGIDWRELARDRRIQAEAGEASE